MRDWDQFVTAATAALGLAGVLALVAVQRPTREPALLPPIAERESSAQPSCTPDPGYLGVTVAGRSAVVAATLDGRVESLAVRFGDHVAEGVTLGTIDASSSEKDVALATALFAGAKAELTQAKVEFEKARSLAGRRAASDGVFSVEDQENAAFQQRSAAARIDLARAHVAEQSARLAQARVLRARATVVAPFDGVVSAIFCERGSAVQMGSAMVQVLAGGQVLVRFAVPKANATEAVIGRQVRVVSESSETATATIDRIAPEFETGSGMLFVEGRVSGGSAQANWKFGQKMRVYFDAPSQGCAPSAPARAAARR